MAEMTEMQVHEERVMNLVESSSGNPTITPLTKTNAHRAESIRRIGTDKDAVAFHFRKKSTGMYAGCGRLHRRLQSADRLLHCAELCE